ncbi:MAG: PIN domain-containing protein, partial [Dehalococcoidia bacterium]|nr:PIN domain-containing protein [Dehalococcoidia bacterium]
MRYLLDTHAFIWWTTDDHRLSAGVRAIMQADNEVFFSVASVWEISIKAQLGRLEFDYDPTIVIPLRIAAYALTVL